jgi:hypothetical protein
MFWKEHKATVSWDLVAINPPYVCQTLLAFIRFDWVTHVPSLQVFGVRE